VVANRQGSNEHDMDRRPGVGAEACQHQVAKRQSNVMIVNYDVTMASRVGTTRTRSCTECSRKHAVSHSIPEVRVGEYLGKELTSHRIRQHEIRCHNSDSEIADELIPVSQIKDDIHICWSERPNSPEPNLEEL